MFPARVANHSAVFGLFCSLTEFPLLCACNRNISDVYEELSNNGLHGFTGNTEQFTSAVSAASIEIRIKRIVIFFAVRLKEKDEITSDQTHSEVFRGASSIRVRKSLKTAVIYGGWSTAKSTRTNSTTVNTFWKRFRYFSCCEKNFKG